MVSKFNSPEFRVASYNTPPQVIVVRLTSPISFLSFTNYALSKGLVKISATISLDGQ